MRKNSFEKILNGIGCSTSIDFTAKEKERLFSFFEKYGMKRGTSYNRFFRDGFSRWEIMGIEGAVREYCDKSEIPFPGNLPDFFRNCEAKEAFKAYMGVLGMSHVTVRKRFNLWSFKEWEIMGVERLIDMLLEEEKEVDDA